MTSDAKPRSTVWTPANIVTLIRICCIPLFLAVYLVPWLGDPQDFVYTVLQPWLGAFLFVLIAFTDKLDGYLARSRNEVTDFGKLMDPLADKILVISALVAVVEMGQMPTWPVVIIAAREFIVSGIRMLAASRGIVLAARSLGKAKTVFQMISVVAFMLKDAPMMAVWPWFSFALQPLSWVLLAIALALTIASLVLYADEAVRVLGATSSNKHAAQQRLAALEAECRSSAESVISRAIAQKKTLATAESLTGGLICSTLTSIPGASSAVRGGSCTYANEAKNRVLDVDAEVLATKGAVSRETVVQMANGARSLYACDYAVSASGIAGPASDESGLPVGTVWLALSGPFGTLAHEYRFSGDREAIRLQAVEAALHLFLKALGETDAVGKISAS